MAIPVPCDSSVIVENIISDRKNSNSILQLEELLLGDNEDEIPKIITSVKVLFVHFLEKKEMVIQTPNQTDNDDPQVQYATWLVERYDDFKEHLMIYLHHDNSTIQIAALDALLVLIQTEANNPLQPSIKKLIPVGFLKILIEALIKSDCDIKLLVKYFHRHSTDNVKFHTFIVLLAIISESVEKDVQFVRNTFVLLKTLAFPTKKQDDDSQSQGANDYVRNRRKVKKAFSQVWVEFLKCNLPKELYKEVIGFVTEKVLANLTNPLLLTDFLTDAYSVRGVVSLLALKGIFFLIQNNNLDFVGFYKKLYSLFTVEVLTSKFNSRFFYLADKFLSSVYLPQYLVEAFAKRLSRLCLFVPPNVILVIFPMISNLLIRHPNLQRLIHSPDTTEVEKDPYNFEQEDPALSQAVDSSLWEIKSLQNHWHPDVSKAAHFINKKQPDWEWNITSYTELTTKDLLCRESDVEVTDIVMSYDKPSGFFLRKEDVMNDLWTL